MIILIHTLYFVFKFALQWYRKQMVIAETRSLAAQAKSGVVNPEKRVALLADAEECLKFSTPVYRQRYATVQDVLLDLRWRNEIQCVVDFGCAEFGFFQYLKHLIGVSRVLMVDIDETLLKENKFRVQPLTADYLKQRGDPLVVEILSGSIADPDYRLKACDAVVGIEIIEHLYPDTLAALPYNIFGFAQPKIAVFTTPNADFNVLFPNFKGRRHDDHKFEWTRDQFEDWGRNITTRFPNYLVTFQGIGVGPEGSESLGCCSQMAVFQKQFDLVHADVSQQRAEPVVPANESFGVCTHYSYSIAQRALLAEDLLGLMELPCHGDSVLTHPNQYYKIIDIITYPHTVDVRSSEEKMLQEATYQILRHASPKSRFYNYESGYVEIPLYEVVKNFNGYFATEEEIRRILIAANFKIADCTLMGTDESCECIQYNIDMDESTTSKSNSEYERSDNDYVEEEEEVASNVTQQNINSSSSEYDDEGHSSRVAHKDDIATPSDPLVDSGYQKSLSNAEWSPQSPIESNFEVEGPMLPKLDINDLKDSIKARLNLHNNRKNLNNRLVSEWRRFAVTPGASRVKSTVAGRVEKRSKRDPSRKEDYDEDSAEEDVRSITDVIVFNSLNRVAEDAEVVNVAFVERPQYLALEIPRFIVENGDLANNNRDDEGNNYPDNVDAAEEDPNENLLPAGEDVVDQQRILAELQPQQVAAVDELSADDAHQGGQEEDALLHLASREALYDPNSEQDLLEEASDYVLEAGTSDAAPASRQEDPAENISVLPMNESPFPLWLLRLVGAIYSTPQEGDFVDVVETDEAHYYCQGDGLEVDANTSSSSSSSAESMTDEAQAEHTLSENEVSSLPPDMAAVSLANPSALEVVGHGIDMPVPMLSPRPSSTSNDSGTDEFFDTIDDSNASSPRPSSSGCIDGSKKQLSPYD